MSFTDEWGAGWEMGRWGRMTPVPDTSDMTDPVRCLRCRGIYDMSKVTVTSRYADCSVWKAPCCGAVVDDRPGGGGIVGTSRPDIERLRR